MPIRVHTLLRTLCGRKCFPLAKANNYINWCVQLLSLYHCAMSIPRTHILECHKERLACTRYKNQNSRLAVQIYGRPWIVRISLRMDIQFLLLGALIVLSSVLFHTQAMTREPFQSDCNRFYETRVLSCPPDLHWNAQLQQCGTQSLSGCSATATDNLSVTCAEKLGQLIPYPGDCTRFIQCDYLPFVKNCPQYLFWNSKLLTCDKKCV